MRDKASNVSKHVTMRMKNLSKVFVNVLPHLLIMKVMTFVSSMRTNVLLVKSLDRVLNVLPKKTVT